MEWIHSLARSDVGQLERVEERLFALMLLIRGVEGAIEKAHRTAAITGSFHSSLGQEICAAAVCLGLRDDDIVTSNHRGHGHALGKGVSAEAVIAEMFRRTNGASGGRGGSMHIHDRSVGFYGETAIVGGGLGWASGAAWARRRQGGTSIAATFAGDGAFVNGVFAEAIRVSDFWDSPCLFVCENNGWAHSMRADRVLGPPGAITRMVTAMGVRAELVDGQDPIGVHESAMQLIEYVREGHTAFLEVEVFRVKAHSVNDPDYLYRPKREGVDWLSANDPIDVLRSYIAPERQAQLQDAVDLTVNAALVAAASGPHPTSTDALRGVYATPGLAWYGRA